MVSFRVETRVQRAESEFGVPALCMDTAKHRCRARPDVEPRRFGFCTGSTAATTGRPAPKTARPGRATFATFPAREDAADSSREPGRKGQTHRPAQRGASDLHSDIGRHDSD